MGFTNKTKIKKKFSSAIKVTLILSIVIIAGFLLIIMRYPSNKLQDTAMMTLELEQSSIEHIDPLDTIDQILNSMEFANISFNAPDSININESALIHLVLAVEETIDNLKKLIEAEGEKIGARIRVSNNMEARLTGYNFQITAITPEVQAVSRKGTTEWKWEIKPKEGGEQTLHLTISAVLNVEGTSIPKTIRTFDRKIDVKITMIHRANAFLTNNWKWLWTALLVPFLLWFWRKIKKKEN